MQDANDLVVQAVGYVYFQAVADEARIATDEAPVQTAQTLFDQATDQVNAGTVADIDALRSKVELQTRQQQLIAAKNDIQASALMNQRPAKVQKAAEQIRELFLFTILTDVEMQDAISKRTGSTPQTKVRWTKFRELVDPVIAGTLVEPRFFDFEFRRNLYEKSPACQRCKNEIHSLDDSTVDHIIPYSKGGKPVPGNGQLAHRGCNARKNAQLPEIAATAS